MVLAAGPELIEDIRRAPDDVLSIYEPTIEVGIVCDTYESHLTRISSFNLNILLTCWTLTTPFTILWCVQNWRKILQLPSRRSVKRLSRPLMIGSQRETIVRVKLNSKISIIHIAYAEWVKVPYHGNVSTSDLLCNESCFCWTSSMSVIVLRLFNVLLIFFQAGILTIRLWIRHLRPML